MTTKPERTEAQTIAYHKRILYDYNRFKDLKGRYNVGNLIGDVFTLSTIKEGRVICSFNINTFLPLPTN